MKEELKNEYNEIFANEDKTAPLALIFAVFIIFIYCCVVFNFCAKIQLHEKGVDLWEEKTLIANITKKKSNA